MSFLHVRGRDVSNSSTSRLRRRSWTLKDFQQALHKNSHYEGDAPWLTINITGLRYKREKMKESLLDLEPPSKRVKDTDIRAQITLKIWESRTKERKEKMQIEKPCTIRVCKSRSGQESALVRMSRPFEIDGDQLVDRGSDGKLQIAQGFTMQITIASTCRSDPWPPIPINVPKPRTSVSHVGGETQIFPILVARWSKLNEAPPAGLLLEVKAYQDGEALLTKLGLDIDMKWSSSAGALAAYNAARSQDHSPAPHLPTPISETEPISARLSVRWTVLGTYKNLEEVHFVAYLCPFCDKLKFENLDEYHFHLINSHDIFKFKVHCEGEKAENGARMVVNVMVDVNDNYRARAANNVPDDREMHWERPRDLFDLEAYLKGDESWVGKAAGGRSSRQIPAIRAQEMSRSTSQEGIKATSYAATEVRPRDQVPDLPEVERRRHKVPPAPKNIQFFRSTVKRPLQEGEWLSESDDEIDESWLLQKHEETIESFQDISSPEKEFIRRYDSYMLRENLSSNVHLNEALVRFCRKNREWLRKKEMRTEFHKNAAILLLHNVLKPTIVRTCTEIIDGAKETDDGDISMDVDEQENKISGSGEAGKILEEDVSNTNLKTVTKVENPLTPEKPAFDPPPCRLKEVSINSAEATFSRPNSAPNYSPDKQPRYRPHESTGLNKPLLAVAKKSSSSTRSDTKSTPPRSAGSSSLSTSRSSISEGSSEERARHATGMPSPSRSGDSTIHSPTKLSQSFSPMFSGNSPSKGKWQSRHNNTYRPHPTEQA